MEQKQNSTQASQAPVPKTQMSKKKFRIGDLAKELQVKKFVIRFWEKEFGLKSDRSQGGQRYYTHDDFNAFKAIKFLLYKQGFTIAGAKVQLENLFKKYRGKLPSNPEVFADKPITAAVKTEELPTETKNAAPPKPITVEKKVPYIPKDFLNEVKTFKEKLLRFKKTLE